MAGRSGPGTASETPGEPAEELHSASSTEGMRAFRRWVQQAGVARYSAEMAAQYTELEISRFTSMLQARLSILSDLEMVLYLALLLGPQVMAACLHEVPTGPSSCPASSPPLRPESGAECSAYPPPAASACDNCHPFSRAPWSALLRACPARVVYARPAAPRTFHYPTCRLPTAPLWWQTHPCIPGAGPA